MELLQIIVTGLFSTIVALGSIWLKHYLDQRKKNSEESQYERISQQDVDSMLEIQNFIDSFRELWNLDRVGIFQFHNGGKFFHGVPMKKYSQTFESVSHGVSKSKEHNQKQEDNQTHNPEHIQNNIMRTQSNTLSEQSKT